MAPAHTQDRLIYQLGQAYAEKEMCARMLASRRQAANCERYRSQLTGHLAETRLHVDSLKNRLVVLGEDTTSADIDSQLQGIASTVSDLLPQFLHCEGSAESLLRHAREECAVEAREVATFYLLESLATELGDSETASICTEIRGADERAFLSYLHETIPALVSDTVHKPQQAHDRLTESTVAKLAAAMVRRTLVQTVRLARKLAWIRNPPQAAEASVTATIPGYDALGPEAISARLARLNQRDLCALESYERRHRKRPAVLERIAALRVREPWPDYDELTVAEIVVALADADRQLAAAVCEYERSHRHRNGVIQCAQRRLSLHNDP